MPTIGSSSGSIKARKGSRLSTGTTSSYRSSKTPSLLNGNGDGKSIPTGADPDASPSQSRSSSAQDSYSTSATTYEDAEDATTTTSSTKTAGAKSSSKEAKGNVIVSVRVRPDANTTEAARSVGEWGLDGRRGLISYKGKEGGDYHYGMFDLVPPNIYSLLNYYNFFVFSVLWLTVEINRQCLYNDGTKRKSLRFGCEAPRKAGDGRVPWYSLCLRDDGNR